MSLSLGWKALLLCLNYYLIQGNHPILLMNFYIIILQRVTVAAVALYKITIRYQLDRLLNALISIGVRASTITKNQKVNLMNNELIKMQDMDILEQKFQGDSIMTVKLKSNGKVYVGVKWITQALGFNKNNHDRQVKNIQSDIVLSKGASNLTLPTKGGNQKSLCIELDYLPLWLAKISITPAMKREHPEVADRLVEYQLKAKDVLADAFLGKTKEWDLHREVGKVDRKRMTSSISQNIYNAQSKTYSDYTNMVYDVLFGMTAKEIRESRDIKKKSQLTRDYLTKDELKLVDEAETIVTALVSLGFKKDYILDQLRRKFTKKIETA